MSETRRVLTYTVAVAVLIAFASGAYVWARSAVDANRGVLAFKEYFECLTKVATFDWSKFPGQKPSGSEVCKELASRQRT
jgi:hypothetical protein